MKMQLIYNTKLALKISGLDSLLLHVSQAEADPRFKFLADL